MLNFGLILVGFWIGVCVEFGLDFHHGQRWLCRLLTQSLSWRQRQGVGTAQDGLEVEPAPKAASSSPVGGNGRLRHAAQVSGYMRGMRLASWAS